MDAERATRAFQDARLIDPGNPVIATGLQRAGTLDELSRLLTDASTYEADGRLALAHAAYASAAQLDPHAAGVAEALERVKGRLAEQEFRTMMSAGLDAFHRAEYDEALTALLDAQRFRPESVEVADAIEMVREGRLHATIKRLENEGFDLEVAERWQAARTAYVQVLGLDPAVQFAQEGKTRCEEMITLFKHARTYIDDADRLLRAQGRDAAARIVVELEAVRDRGPRTGICTMSWPRGCRWPARRSPSSSARTARPSSACCARSNAARSGRCGSTCCRACTRWSGIATATRTFA